MNLLKSQSKFVDIRTGYRGAQLLVVGLLLSALSACGEPPVVPGTIMAPGASASPVVSSESQTLSLEQQQVLSDRMENSPYRLGPNDVISVSVYSHPELSSPQPGVTGTEGGVMITSDGTVGLPLIGNVRLGGMTIDRAQRVIAADYAATINTPNVTVQLVSAQSLRYYLLGAFSSPGVKYPGHTLTLLDALSLGGTVELTNADLYQAYVVEHSRKLPVDFHALLLDGDLSQNIPLESGATVVIPPASTENVFIFGAVGKPGAVSFQNGQLSLLQALSVADLDLPNYTSAQLSQVRIIRAHGQSADLIVVDARKILQGQAFPYPLVPGDIVFVPPNGIATWNQALDKLLPSLATVSGLLNPFVSIAYLSRNNGN